jgi:hypothetical protein
VVHGVISDSELLELEALVRRSPTIPARQKDHPLAEISSTVVHGDWPIGRVEREAPDAIVVWLMRREQYAQLVRLRLENTTWRVDTLGAAIVN